MFLVHEKDALMRAQLHAATDVITGHGVGQSGASLGVLNMLPYVQAFDTKTGMPYVCDPYKKAPDDKFDNRWKMVVPPCPDFKKCLFPWNEGGLLVGGGGGGDRVCRICGFAPWSFLQKLYSKKWTFSINPCKQWFLIVLPLKLFWYHCFCSFFI